MGQKVDISKTPPSEDKSVLDIYRGQLIELAEIRNPAVTLEGVSKIAEELKGSIDPVYINFPWRSKVVKSVPEAEFMEIKTNRNQLLITADEQKHLFNNLSVSIAGMSVGSSIVYGIVGSGIAKKITIADDDIFSTSNLNRVQATVFDIGESKVDTVARRSQEMNPFIEVYTLDGRVDEDSLQSFIKPGITSVVFDEIDDFAMKVRIREYARQNAVPIIMLTNLGDGVLIDVERYDKDSATKLFNGKVEESTLDKIRKSEVIDIGLMKELSKSLIDVSVLPSSAIESLEQIGVSLVGRPQLYSTVALDGGIAPYILRRIFINNDLGSGRYYLGLMNMETRT